MSDILDEIRRREQQKIPFFKIATWVAALMTKRFGKNTTTSRDVRRFWRCPRCKQLNPPDLNIRCLKCNGVREETEE